MPEPRTGKNARDRLNDLLTVAIFAVICGADGWVAKYAQAKRHWLGTFLYLPGADLDDKGCSLAGSDPVELGPKPASAAAQGVVGPAGQGGVQTSCVLTTGG